MRIVIALGGNALLQRGEPMLYEKELSSVRKACQAIASIADHHELIVTHGNGPQVGLIALQQLALGNPPAYPLDTMGAQSIGLIGYLITRELKHFLPANQISIPVLFLYLNKSYNNSLQQWKYKGPSYYRIDAGD